MCEISSINDKLSKKIINQFFIKMLTKNVCNTDIRFTSANAGKDFLIDFLEFKKTNLLARRKAVIIPIPYEISIAISNLKKFDKNILLNIFNIADVPPVIIKRINCLFSALFFDDII